jgi:hypothetical protein
VVVDEQYGWTPRPRPRRIVITGVAAVNLAAPAVNGDGHTVPNEDWLFGLGDEAFIWQ